MTDIMTVNRVSVDGQPPHHSNTKIEIAVITFVPSQKLVFDFLIIITLIELVLIQTPK